LHRGVSPRIEAPHPADRPRSPLLSGPAVEVASTESSGPSAMPTHGSESGSALRPCTAAAAASAKCYINTKMWAIPVASKSDFP
jgi:hypothetical protein